MHTLFQLSDTEFLMKVGSKAEKALHLLLFHPERVSSPRFWIFASVSV